LLLFDTHQGKIIASYTISEGLCNNAVLNIEKDNHGNLWLSTFNGLSKFNPVNKVFKNFYQSDGLQSNQFSYRAATKLSNGDLLFGGANGFNLFSPEKVELRHYMPPLTLTNISVNNKQLEDVANMITQTDNGEIRQLTVPYQDATLSFFFSALEFSSPDKINYSYYLKGWDNGWINNGNIKTSIIII